MQSYRNLDVWKLAHELTLQLYRDSVLFPKQEAYGLTGQVRRAASSIGANIAEGCGRGTDGELRQSLQYAMGSATELDNHLLLARDLGFLDADMYAARLEDVTRIEKMLSSFIVKLRPAAAKIVARRSANGQ
jgi:four helix bundle protein